MNIQFLNGGLANQTFQYIFSRYMALNSDNKEIMYLDDSYFATNTVHNGYEIEKVFPNAKPSLLSSVLDKDIWEYILKNKRNGMSLPQTMSDIGMSVVMLSEYDNYKEFNPFNGNIVNIDPNRFNKELKTITSQNDNEIFYFHGYFLHPGYFNSCKETLINELSFPELNKDDFYNINIMDKIRSSSMYSGCSKTSVAIHVRRGDFVKLGIETKPSFYKNAVDKIKTKYLNTSFFVFSDDIEWCKRNMFELGLNKNDQIMFVEGNNSGNNYIDLQLMTNCEVLVFGRSSFGQLAWLLNDNLKDCISEILI